MKSYTAGLLTMLRTETDDVLRPEFERMGAMVMGRDSYDHAEELWGERPPFEVPIFVLTHRTQDDDVRDGTTFFFRNEIMDDALDRAKQVAAGKDVALHGGGAIQQGIRRGLLDELQLHVVPVLLGNGRKLFDDVVSQPTQMEIMRVVEGPGVTHLKYRLR